MKVFLNNFQMFTFADQFNMEQHKLHKFQKMGQGW